MRSKVPLGQMPPPVKHPLSVNDSTADYKLYISGAGLGGFNHICPFVDSIQIKISLLSFLLNAAY